MIYGFYISILELTGEDLPPARIEFSKGFNLVSGGSDTGKSYAFGCLEYMLGKIEPPTFVNESSGYINVFLEITSYSGKTFTLLRKLTGGDYTIKECDLSNFFKSNAPIETLSAYSQSSKSISDFLLNLCGIDSETYIKSNQANTKRKFTFTVLRNLTFINETTITNRTSPIYGDQSYTDFTFYKNALSFILTGKNANDLISAEDNQSKKSWLNGKIDFVKSQIIHFRDNLEKLHIQRLQYTDDQNESVDDLKLKLEKLDESLTTYLDEKSNLLNDLEEKKSTLIYKSELLERLNLLQKHYISDQKRLDFILDGEQMMSQLNTVDCPVCENVLNEDKINYIHNTSEIKESIFFEKEKINLKIKDLNTTIQDNIKDIESLKGDILIVNLQFQRIEKMINEVLNPNLDNVKAEIFNSSQKGKIDAQIEVYNDELSYYQTEENGLIESLQIDTPSQNTTNDGSGIKNLSKIIQRILKSWNYQENIDIEFNNNHKVFDIEINGKPRGSYGKGMRSISYTAFILSVLKYCTQNSRPFSNLLVFDSPLTTYNKGLVTGNETNEEIDSGIQESFFRNLATTQENCQIIMFDNKFPNNDISSKINFEYFTKDKKSGRYGLFPQ
jgi:hypothetical protein